MLLSLHIFFLHPFHCLRSLMLVTPTIKTAVIIVTIPSGDYHVHAHVHVGESSAAFVEF